MQTKKFLLYKIIPKARFNHATGRFWPVGRMFDTPGLRLIPTSLSQRYV